ncbi:uncharacterized protein LOC126905658 [Daktulosphaira vitifoliae]|uniref:uncharacterized protein LOC126905658 n=1 Tax=Daktulosphaira vitifoliae TaxID=58002 RepID=UPI0021AA5FC2|nr:uncharacterized protein LOC126905658 [Daktulosphaira vitifoliae]
MHLKIILIFCSVCFFTVITSIGLTAQNINFFGNLLFYHDNSTLLSKSLQANNIQRPYSSYNREDTTIIKIWKLLMFLSKINKPGDDIELEKLYGNDVNNILNEFCRIGTNMNSISKDQCIQFFNSFDFKTLFNNENHENLNGAVNDFMTSIVNENYTLVDVLLEVLKLKSYIKKTIVGHIQSIDKLQDEYDIIVKNIH